MVVQCSNDSAVGLNVPLSRFVLFGLFALFAQQPGLSAAQSTDLQQGIASYNASDHLKAVSYFHSHLAKNQSDATAHYYLANSLLKLGQQEKALSEYRRAFDLSSDATMKRYCTLAIQKATANATQEASPAKPTADETAVTKSLERIKQQSELAKENRIRAGESDAKDKIVRGKYDAKALQAELNVKINNLLQPDAIDIYGRPIYLDHSAEIDALKREYAGRIKEAERLGNEEASAKKAEVAKDATKMLKDVDNLRSQLTDTKHLPGTPSLQATGTNFYTRQYGDPRASATKKKESIPDELLATPEKMILDEHNRAGSSKYRVVKEPQIAEQDKLKLHTPGTDLRVKGKLIDRAE